jgi:hypothetical protein
MFCAASNATDTLRFTAAAPLVDVGLVQFATLHLRLRTFVTVGQSSSTSRRVADPLVDQPINQVGVANLFAR